MRKRFPIQGSDLSKFTQVFSGRAGTRPHISCSPLWFFPALTAPSPCLWSEAFPFPPLIIYWHHKPGKHQARLHSQPEICITCPDPFLALYSFLTSSSTCLSLPRPTLSFFSLALPCGLTSGWCKHPFQFSLVSGMGIARYWLISALA